MSGKGGGSVSSNWLALKAKLSENQKKQVKKNSGSTASLQSAKEAKNNKRKLGDNDNSISDDGQFKRRREIQATLDKAQASKAQAAAAAAEAAAAELKRAKERWKDDRYIGLDCEMVGTGKMGKKSSLARCSIVNYSGEVIYDKFVRSNDYVVDFRTKYSGIRKKDLRKGNAIPLEQCQKEVAAILKGKILVGHALKNDLLALMLKHNRSQIRDTARYRPYMRPHGRKGGKFKPRKLKELCKQFLKLTIQEGEHDSGVDARSAMMLYKLKEEEWEQFLKDQKNKFKNKPSKDGSDDDNDDEDDDIDDDDDDDDDNDEEDEEEEEEEEEDENNEDGDDDEDD